MLLDAALVTMEGELRAAMETAIKNVVATARTRLESLLQLGSLGLHLGQALVALLLHLLEQ